MRERGGGCLSALLVVLSLAVVALGAGALYFVVTEQGPFARAEPEAASPETLKPKSFAEYDWDELSEVADMIAAASSDEEAERVASEWGVSVGDVRALPLADGRQASLTVIGIRCDQRAGGAGVAGLTLMTSPIALRSMGDSAADEGTWETSALRRWLSDEGANLLPEGLLEHIAPVEKVSNAMSVTGDESSVVTTDDVLWPLSVSEVCGEVDLFAREYGDQVRARTYYIDYTRYDAALSSEGAQYPYFAEKNVSVVSDASGCLGLTYGGASVSWWYRSAYPASEDEDGYLFYQVMESGYPTTVAAAEQEAGVVVGLCL